MWSYVWIIFWFVLIIKLILVRRFSKFFGSFCHFAVFHPDTFRWVLRHELAWRISTCSSNSWLINFYISSIVSFLKKICKMFLLINLKIRWRTVKLFVDPTKFFPVAISCVIRMISHALDRGYIRRNHSSIQIFNTL